MVSLACGPGVVLLSGLELKYNLGRDTIFSLRRPIACDHWSGLGHVSCCLRELINAGERTGACCEETEWSAGAMC